ncbi:hypothetical protein [Salinirubrum litoreum]|uniref:ABC-2 type transport system permease protein n=1 Tax=Salinirubrum litoreum TaxID=1126234 RepID=A0ABD5RAQ2_9EURY|nr:hypothetical protein [Salinirubrum litoreum]
MIGLRALFVTMVREEWRFHSELFGGRRFAGFPVFVTLLAAGAVQLLQFTGTSLSGVVAGLHALVFAFGLHTGTIGLLGRDSVRDLLGEVSLLLFADRTLPLSRTRLLAVFVVKDVAYYAVLFLLPLALAFVPSVVAGRVPATRVPLLWLTTTLTFSLGVVVTLAVVALRTRGRRGTLGLLVGATAVGGGVALGVDLVAWTPYTLLRDGVGIGPLFRATTPTVLFGLLGLFAYDTRFERPARTTDDRFSAWRARLRDDDGLLTRTLLDVARSSGGLVKVPFSAGIILAVAVVLVEFAGVVTGRTPATGVSLGALLGLSGFTTYNWLTGFDGPRSYLAFPVSIADVLRAKFRAFLLLGPPVALGFYLVAVAWFGAPLLDAIAGAVLCLGLQSYLFGTTVYLTGLQPDEFLFDTVLFAGFTLAVAVVLVPLLVVGFVVPPSGSVLVGLTVASLVIGLVGVSLARRAESRWTRIYRDGDF